jgi:hypothetical protein
LIIYTQGRNINNLIEKTVKAKTQKKLVVNKINRWKEDTMITISRSTRAKLKVQAALKGRTIKDYIEDLANGK